MMSAGYLVDNKVTCYRICNPYKGTVVQSEDVIWLMWMFLLNLRSSVVFDVKVIYHL